MKTRSIFDQTDHHSSGKKRRLSWSTGSLVNDCAVSVCITINDDEEKQSPQYKRIQENGRVIYSLTDDDEEEEDEKDVMDDHKKLVKNDDPKNNLGFSSQTHTSKRIRLSEEKASFLLFYGYKEQPKRKVINMIIEFIVASTGDNTSCFSYYCRKVLWRRFHDCIHLQNKREIELNAKWMKVVFGSTYIKTSDKSNNHATGGTKHTNSSSNIALVPSRQNMCKRQKSILNEMNVVKNTKKNQNNEKDLKSPPILIAQPFPPGQNVSGPNKNIPTEWIRPTNARPPLLVTPLSKMLVDEVHQHIQLAKSEGSMKRFEKLSEILEKVMTHPRNRHGIFNEPVDPVALNLPFYTKIVKEPMDLGTVKRKLEAGVYESVQQFEKDVRLVFYNAMMFNPPHHYVHIDAEVLSLRFQEEMSKENGRVSTNKSRLHGHSCKVCFGNTCAICHQKCIELATPNYTCSMGCGTEIRKGTTYYLTRDGTRLYCKRCYGKAAKTFFVSHQNNISSDLRTDVEDIGGILPGFFSKERCDAEVEPWVKCSKCEKWMHQICGLYNPVYGIYSDSHRYICPRCIAHIKDQSATFSPSTEDTPHISFASIPVCEMSEYIEGFMRQGLLEVNENEAAASLGIRVISFANEKMSFSETLVDAFKSNSASSIRFVPKEVLFISRGIFLYQTHQGADVCLFALFTQEFGDDCSLEQNRRSFYIAYIDSIRYLQPASARTTAYHLIMMAYFDHARKRGFERAHIWSCPPQKRISYVFWCRPPFQKTPSSDHLRRWYETLLKKSKEMGIVMSWTNMYERYFSTTSNKNFEMSDTNLSYGTRRSMAHVVDPIDYEWPSPELPPLFEGDFIPSELERIVSRMTEKVVNVSFKARLKLRDVFVQCRSAVQRLKNDLLVVDLNTSCANSRIGCNPTRHIPTWCSGTSRLFGSRFKFHQLCSHNSYQFDSLRRAKHSTMMLVHHFFNSDIVQVNIFCSECSLLITHAVYWRCRQCTQYILCDLCYKHKGAEHVHSMIFDRRMTI